MSGRYSWKARTPNIFYAKDGEIYDSDSLKAIAIDGAYSVDKEYQLERGEN